MYVAVATEQQETRQRGQRCREYDDQIGETWPHGIETDRYEQVVATQENDEL